MCFLKIRSNAIGDPRLALNIANDQEEANEGKLLNAVTWGVPSDYFKIVEHAYRKFYLRDGFVKEYCVLLKHGY